jgi:hypothetical protein
MEGAEDDGASSVVENRGRNVGRKSSRLRVLARTDDGHVVMTGISRSLEKLFTSSHRYPHILEWERLFHQEKGRWSWISICARNSFSTRGERQWQRGMSQ